MGQAAAQCMAASKHHAWSKEAVCITSNSCRQDCRMTAPLVRVGLLVSSACRTESTRERERGCLPVAATGSDLRVTQYRSVLCPPHPILCASALLRPGSATNMLSVSPYTTRARQLGCASTRRMAFSRVTRPDCSSSSHRQQQPSEAAVSGSSSSSSRQHAGILRGHYCTNCDQSSKGSGRSSPSQSCCLLGAAA